MPYSASSRLWSSSEHAQLLSPDSHVGLLCVTCLWRPNSSLSPPVLLATGPTASTPCGEVHSLPPQWLPTSDSSEVSFTSFTPLTVSVNPKPRTLVLDHVGAIGSHHKTLASCSPTIFVPDSCSMCGYVATRESSATIMDTTLSTSPLCALKLWVQDVCSSSSSSSSSPQAQAASNVIGA